MAKPPKINPSITFTFKIHLASKLKHAIAALSDVDFNKQGTGLIEVDHNGFEITARNTETHVAGLLRLNATGLINFCCCKDVKNKIVKLNEISEKLELVDNEDFVTVYNIEGSNHLCFTFESAPVKGFAVELLESDEEFEIEKFPKIIYACEAVMLSDQLREMDPGPKLATLEITDQTLFIYLGTGVWRYFYDVKKSRPRGMAPGQKHMAVLGWPHFESLKKASFVAVGLLFCIVMNPPNTIMMRFNLKELGDLVFINEALGIVTNADEEPGMYPGYPGEFEVTVKL